MMTVSVLKDLIPFIVVLMGQNAVFAIMFIASDHMGEDFINSQEAYENFSTFTKAFTNVWDLMNGMGDYKGSKAYGLIIYYCVTILVNIGMLNIVISVVSETYERVSMYKNEA